MNFKMNWFKFGICVIFGFLLYVFAAGHFSPCSGAGCAFGLRTVLFGLIPAVVLYLAISLAQ